MSDCVPYAVHIVTGKAYEEVLAQAKNIRGWDEVNGIHPVGAWLLLKDFGCQITQMLSAGYRVTLARFKKQLDPQKTYIISTDAHWFVIRRGSHTTWQKRMAGRTFGTTSRFFTQDLPSLRDLN
ncbi:TPA: hypothetical protein ACXI12_005630 [Pseudomonas aeruginosa]